MPVSEPGWLFNMKEVAIMLAQIKDIDKPNENNFHFRFLYMNLYLLVFIKLQ